MNLKTTVFLIILAAAGGGYWFAQQSLKPKDKPSESLKVLQNQLVPSLISHVDIRAGSTHVVLERGPRNEWTMPGNWPVRKREVDQLIGLLSRLHSRFAAIPITSSPGELKRFGLDPSQETVEVAVAGKKDTGPFHLLLGEEPGSTNRFSRPTFLRLDDAGEVVRLAPNIVAALKRPADYYQQRQLFPSERVQEGDSQEKVDLLVAQAVAVKSAAATYTLIRKDGVWEIKEPVHDRIDPDKLKSILTAIPDIWAEQFLSTKKTLAEMGLQNPEDTIQVTKANGQTVTLLVGKQSQIKTRTVTRPAPPNNMGLPQQPQQEVIHDEYRFAKLQDNNQIFEIRGDKRKDVLVALDSLRDARLARFRTDEARRVEIVYGGLDVVVEKDKDQWKLRKPIEGSAEGNKITELLDKLSNLQARDKDVLDKADPKANQLDPPAGKIIVDADESKGTGDAKTKVAKKFTFDLGKDEKAKLYVKVEGWPRVNLVEDSLLPLVKRPALAYRNRRVLDFNTTDVVKIEVGRANDKFTLEQTKDTWRLAAPVGADADASKVSQLASDLGRLEVVEFISDQAKPDDLKNQFGLSPPALSATINYSKADKPAQTLQIGKQRPGKDDYFAKLSSAPAVFVVKKEIHDLIDTGSLAYRPLQLWQIPSEEIAEVRWQKDGQDQRVRKEGMEWKITEPFEAAALGSLVQPILTDLATLKAERFETHVSKELATYGLDKPFMRVAVTSKTVSKEGTPAKEVIKDRTLLIGKPTAAGAKTRFAKLGDGESIFVIGEKTVAAVDRPALDLLDRGVLTLDSQAIESIQSRGQLELVTLDRDQDKWRATGAGVAFTPDQEVVTSLLGLWSNFRAERFAAYGSKVDPALFGLDKPARIIIVSMKPASAKDKSAAPVKHTLIIGKPVKGEAGAAYARLDKGPAIMVLGVATASTLTRDYLGYIDRSMFHFTPATISGINRTMGKEAMELQNQNGVWQMIKPAKLPADTPTVEGLVAELAALRARRIVSYSVKDLPAFGLDAPAAITLQGKGTSYILRVGKPVEEKGTAPTGDRYAKADGSKAIGVIPASLAAKLLARPIQFRDHTIAQAPDIDRALCTRGPRVIVFAKVDGTWKVIDPVNAEVEQVDWDEFLGNLARLRADDLVAEKPKDLKLYGLDHPEAQWRFQLAGKDVLNLVIGKTEKKDKESRCYAKLANGDMVFLLDAKLTNRVLGEYRNRAIWQALDAAQIDSLRYTSPGHAYALEKKDGVWKVAGKPDLAVKTEAVTETLDALSRLKAERFVADKNADFRLYGLEPPLATLTIETSSGKKVLQIGRTEGDSKRRYAHVPDDGRTDVFIISESDSSHILRDLPAFTQKSGKAPPVTN